MENARIDLADAGNRVVDAGQRVANQWSLGLESTKQRFKEGFDQISQNSNQNLATAGQGIRQRFDVISNILSNNGNRRQLADILATVLSNPVAAAGLAGVSWSPTGAALWLDASMTSKFDLRRQVLSWGIKSGFSGEFQDYVGGVGPYRHVINRHAK